MRHLIYIAFIFSSLLVFSSCSYKQNQVLFEQKSLAVDTTFSKNNTNISNYRIKPQDVLQLTNMQNSKYIVDIAAGTSANTSSASAAQQNETYQVDDDGTIPLTGIGRVKVAGLTRVEARKYIEELYGKDFLKSPLFDLKIINLKVSVFGEVKAPGNFSLTKDKTTLIEVIGEAGGLTDKADEKTVKIIHSGRQNPTTEIVDLSNIKSLTDPRIVLQNNDVIYISQNRKAIRSDNIQNFSTIIQPVLIVLSTALLIITLARR
jgi:polysaccharide export outer membrane protein